MAYATFEQNGANGKLLDAEQAIVVATINTKYELIWTVDISAV
jgi:hypothetical protein